MTTYDYDQAELEAIGAKLEKVEDDFSDKERALLSALFARGLQGVREDAGEDVAGFIKSAKLFVRKQGSEQNDYAADPPGGLNLTVGMGDGSVMPTDQFSLNFTKTV